MDSYDDKFLIKRLAGPEDYSSWVPDITSLLATKDVLHTIEDTPPEDRESEEYKRWIRDDRKARALIMLTLDRSLRPVYHGCETAIELWDCLKDQYEANTRANQVQLVAELSNLKMQPSESITLYMGRAKTILNRLAATECTLEDLELPFIMNGLPSAYDSTVEIFKQRKEAYTYTELHAELVRREQDIIKHDERSNGVALMAYKNKSKKTARLGKNTNGFRGKCYKCGEEGHMMVDCKRSMKQEFVGFAVSEEGLTPGF